nr:MAG TPA: hypothetical protein [Caudoviricetes sp.]
MRFLFCALSGRIGDLLLFSYLSAGSLPAGRFRWRT